MAVTIKDIASAAGVSIATVSRFVNQSGYVGKEAKVKLELIVKEMNYIPNAAAVSLAKRESNVIGVMMPDISNPFYSDVIKGISHICDRENLALLISDCSEDIEKELRTLHVYKQQQVRGLILAPICDEKEDNIRFFKEVESFNSPVIIVDKNINGLDTDKLYYNNILNSHKAAKHMFEKGHKDVLVLAADQNKELGRQRLDGFITAYDNFGYAVPDEHIIYGEFNEEITYHLIKDYYETGGKVKAIYSSNNAMTKGALKAIFELNLYRHIEMFNFEKLELFDISHIKGHYFDQHGKKMGEMAMEMMLKRFNGDESNHNKVMVPLKISSC